MFLWPLCSELDRRARGGGRPGERHAGAQSARPAPILSLVTCPALLSLQAVPPSCSGTAPTVACHLEGTLAHAANRSLQLLWCWPSAAGFPTPCVSAFTVLQRGPGAGVAVSRVTVWRRQGRGPPVLSACSEHPPTPVTTPRCHCHQAQETGPGLPGSRWVNFQIRTLRHEGHLVIS